MMSFSGKRNPEAQRVADFIEKREWGFMILDEVQTVPAEKVSHIDPLKDKDNLNKIIKINIETKFGPLRIESISCNLISPFLVCFFLFPFLDLTPVPEGADAGQRALLPGSDGDAGARGQQD